MKIALYRKYRSKNLDEIIGQEHITDILKNAINSNKISHAYLLTGPRGVGKTSIARILAHEINNLEYSEDIFHPDIIEIDAASNNSVEDIRDLREKIEVAPLSAKYRIYIIDEVHMLSKSAFNALLKTLEEPPTHAIFILATTDAHKLPATILSRTQQFTFRLISEKKIVEHLRFISEKEGIKISDDALKIIAERGEGSFRDSITILDQISSLGFDNEINAKNIENALGLTPKNVIFELLDAYETQNIAEIIKIIDEFKMNGGNFMNFCEQFYAEIKKILPQKPHLSKIAFEILKIRNSNFIEAEILATLVTPTKYIPQPAQTNRSVTQIAQLPEPSKTTKPENPPEKIEQPQKEAKTETPKNSETPQNSNPEIQKSDLENFNWSNFIKECENISKGAVSTTLKQINHALSGDKLIIFTGNKFKKNQLEKPNSKNIIISALKNLGFDHLEIEISENNKPPEDEALAKVFDIMGGGEEVKIDG